MLRVTTIAAKAAPTINSLYSFFVEERRLPAGRFVSANLLKLGQGQEEMTLAKETVKTKKITDFIVAYEATEHHPAQIKEVSKDVVEGIWSLVEFSGALPQERVNSLLRRVDKLQKATIQAREEANNHQVEQRQVAAAIFGYLFAE